MKKTAALFLLLILSQASYCLKKDSLLRILAGPAQDTIKIKACIGLSAHYRSQNADSCERYCRLAEKFLGGSGNPYWKAKVYLLFAGLYSYARGEFREAEKYADAALRYALQSRNMKLIGDTYLTAAAVQGSLGNFTRAVTYLLKAENCHQLSHNIHGLSGVYNNLGILYYNQHNYVKALEYYKKSLAIKMTRNNATDLSAAYQNIAGVFYDLKKLDSALHYTHLSYEKSLEDNDLIGAAMACSGKAMILRQMNRYKESLKSEEECRALSKATGDRWTLANSYHGSGLIYRKQKNYSKAIQCFNESIRINTEIGAKKELTEAYEGMAMVYADMKNYQAAFDYFRRFAELNDSVIGENVRKSLQEVEVKFATEKKEKEIALLNKAKAEDSLKIARKEMEVKAKDLQIEKRRGQVKYLSVIALLLAGFGAWIFVALRNKHKANLIIQQQKKEVELQKLLVDEKQKEIIDSINYASRIQNTVLPKKNFLDQIIPDSFILFKPKDIVSGDFYWASAVGQDRPATAEEGHAAGLTAAAVAPPLFYLAVCDSTGHGVPGAFMSLLNTGFLSEAVNEKNIREPHRVFEYVRERLIGSVSGEGQKDGFDGILVCIDRNAQIISYAAANNAPLLVHNGEATHLGCDKMPVGKGEKTDHFTLFTANYENGSCLYLFTDGYADQFGGPRGKKFKYRQLETLLTQISGNTLEQQRSTLDQTFEAWRGALEQVDDVCIVGIRL